GQRGQLDAGLHADVDVPDALEGVRCRLRRARRPPHHLGAAAAEGVALGTSAARTRERSVSGLISGAYRCGTASSTAGRWPIVVKTYPPACFSGSQSTPSTVNNSEVGRYAAGRPTPQRRTNAGSPQAAVA